MERNNRTRTHAQREAAEIESAYRRTSGSRVSSRKKKQALYRKAAVISICVAVAVLLIAIIATSIYLSNNGDNKVFAENVTIAGVDVGGMSKSEAISAVRIATYKTYTKTDMVVTVLEDTVTISPSVSHVDLNVPDAIEYAFKNSSEGETVDITQFLSLDTAAIRISLNEIGTKYSSLLTQSTYKVTGKMPSLEPGTIEDSYKTLTITIGTPEYSLDLEALYKQIIAAYNSNTFAVNGVCTVREPDALDLNAILAEHYVAPVSAEVGSNYEVQTESYGYGFDVQEAATKIAQAKYGDVIEIKFFRISPDIGSGDISSSMYKDILGSYIATDSESDENRNINLKLACQAINGMIILPGEAFSYNAALGERTEEKGYKPGPSYVGNDTVYTIGGGICQVSSALYYSVLIADLDIISRTSHGFMTSYMPLGMDAAVSWGTLDFTFRNNTKNPIKIEAIAEGGTVTVRLLGTDEKDYLVRLEFEKISETPYTILYEDHTASGYLPGDYVVTPYTGYEVNTYSNKYSKSTDQLISKDFVAYTKYSARDAVICTSTGPSGNPGDVGALPEE